MPCKNISCPSGECITCFCIDDKGCPEGAYCCDGVCYNSPCCGGGPPCAEGEYCCDGICETDPCEEEMGAFRNIPEEYTNVLLPEGECIYMQCTPPNCPYPLCPE